MVIEILDWLYPYLFIPAGLIAVLLGGDRALKPEDEESDLLQIIGGIAGLILLVLTVVLAWREFSIDEHIISKYSMLFSILLSLTLIARPFKQIPLAFVVSVFVLLGLMYVVIANQQAIESNNFFNIQVMIIIILVVVGLIFIISFVQEQFMDTMLWILGWGPIITTFGLILFVQGITLILDFPERDGILSYLPG